MLPNANLFSKRIFDFASLHYHRILCKLYFYRWNVGKKKKIKSFQSHWVAVFTFLYNLNMTHIYDTPFILPNTILYLLNLTLLSKMYTQSKNNAMKNEIIWIKKKERKIHINLNKSGNLLPLQCVIPLFVWNLDSQQLCILYMFSMEFYIKITMWLSIFHTSYYNWLIPPHRICILFYDVDHMILFFDWIYRHFFSVNSYHVYSRFWFYNFLLLLCFFNTTFLGSLFLLSYLIFLI